MPEPPADLETAKNLSIAIEKARASGSYLVAIYHVTDGHKVQLDRLTNNFPVVDFENCVKMLEADLKGERDGFIQQRAAMQEVMPVAPIVDLFGTLPPAAAPAPGLAAADDDDGGDE